MVAALAVLTTAACAPACDRGASAERSQSMTSKSNVDEAAWSAPVEGVRARLIATTTRDPSGRPQVRLDLELENVSDVGTPIAIAWGGLGSVLELAVEDEAGRVLPPAGIGGNDLSPAPYWLELPHGSTLRMPVSRAAYEYVREDRMLFRPLALQAWELPADRRSRFYLTGTLRPLPSADRARFWPGPLALPRLTLQARSR